MFIILEALWSILIIKISVYIKHILSKKVLTQDFLRKIFSGKFSIKIWIISPATFRCLIPDAQRAVEERNIVWKHPLVALGGYPTEQRKQPAGMRMKIGRRSQAETASPDVLRTHRRTANLSVFSSTKLNSTFVLACLL